MRTCRDCARSKEFDGISIETAHRQPQAHQQVFCRLHKQAEPAYSWITPRHFGPVAAPKHCFSEA